MSFIKNIRGLDLEYMMSKMSMNNSKQDEGTGGPEWLCITVYINNSPCSDCTDNLITFLNKNKRVRVKFYVTNLYNIRRKSCKKENHFDKVKKGFTTITLRGWRILCCITDVIWRRSLRMYGKSYLISWPCQMKLKSNFWRTTTREWKAMIEVEKTRMNISRKIWIISERMNEHVSLNGINELISALFYLKVFVKKKPNKQTTNKS